MRYAAGTLPLSRPPPGQPAEAIGGDRNPSMGQSPDSPIPSGPRDLDAVLARKGFLGSRELLMDKRSGGLFTEGVHALLAEGVAYDVIGQILKHQQTPVISEIDFQVWRCSRVAEGRWKTQLVCYDEDGHKRAIHSSQFDLSPEEFTLFYQNDVLHLPSER